MKLFTRKSIKWCAAFVGMTLLSGCADIDVFTWEKGNTQITATVDETRGTRTLVDPNSGTEVTGILWNETDRLGVFGGTTNNAEFKGTFTGTAATGNFTGDLTSGDTPRYAYYPYNAAANGAEVTSVPVSIGYEQDYTDVTSIADNDIKAADNAVQSGSGYHFTFRPMVSMMKFDVNASNPVEALTQGGFSTNEQLVSIHVEEYIPESAEEAAALAGTESLPWVGDFTMNLTNLDEGLTPVVPEEGAAPSAIKLNLTQKPGLNNGSVTAYACVAPHIKQGQTLQIRLETTQHWISFTVTVEKDFEAGVCYDVPLYLSALTEENHVSISSLPTSDNLMTAFKFEVAHNQGKILAKEAYYNGSTTTTRNVTEQALTVDNEKGNVTACIPYLYDFNLVPTFSVASGATVTVNGETQVSGKTAQDFSNPVVYTVTKADGSWRDYTVSVTNTGLPVVVLNGGGSSNGMRFLGTTIPSKDSEFVNTDKITIYDKKGGHNLAEAACGFRLRGNSTSNFPKKPMAIKLDKKAEVLGMPKHKRWCLLASWIDRSLIRNSVAFDIANTIKETNTDGLPWQPHGKTVELVLNGVHAGNYFLCEQIKIDENRLNIQDGIEDVYDAYANPETGKEPGPAPTTDNCGYLLEFDDNYDEPQKFHTNYCQLPCMSKDAFPSQYLSIWQYVKEWVQDVENELYSGNYSAAYEKLDINSVIDYWFVMELTMNNEYRHPKSVYMYKDGAGKLCAGPVWDFDYQTFPNFANISDIYRGYGKTVPSYTMSTLLYSLGKYGGGFDSDSPYMWYPLLFKDATFKAAVKTRWNKVYGALTGVSATIRTLGSENAVSDTYNQKIWPIESKERTGYGWFIDYAGDERLSSYDAVVENLVNMYEQRLNSMNSLINALK